MQHFRRMGTVVAVVRGLGKKQVQHRDKHADGLPVGAHVGRQNVPVAMHFGTQDPADVAGDVEFGRLRQWIGRRPERTKMHQCLRGFNQGQLEPGQGSVRPHANVHLTTRSSNS